MLTLIKNAHIFSPQDLGVQDVLVAGGRIEAMGPELDIPETLTEVYDATGQRLVPGFVDSLVHVLGGGGEGGFTTRTPEVQMSDLITAGVTTLVGALGTDAIGRNLPALITKTKELKAQGIHALFYTGSYHLPVDTLTGDVQRDLVYLEECIGVGEVAIADHRGSQPQVFELARLAADARVGGMLSGKAGIVSIHVGDGQEHLQLLHQVSEQTEVPLTVFYPTHINRNQSLLEAGKQFAQAGGTIDLTTSSNPDSLAYGEVKCARALQWLLDEGVDSGRITCSSDGHASLPEFDEHGQLNSLDVGQVSSLFCEVRDAVLSEGIPLAVALQTITSNPARLLKLPAKGRIEPGLDADLVLLNDQLHINGVMLGGCWMMRDQQLMVKGRFE